MASSPPSSARLFARARRVLPGGVNSPVRAFAAVGGTPPFIDHGHGAHVVDVERRRYLDYVMSWGPLIHGHAPRGLIVALAQAARRGTSFGAPTTLELELGALVCRLVPSIERVRFVNSGTEATMSAVRLARAATGRDKIIKFAGCYHGHGDAFLVQAGSGATTLGVPTSPGVSRATAADTLIADYNDLDSVTRLCRAYRGKIAAIIVEPIAGNMGVVPPATGFLDGLRAMCDRHSALLIFDEVISGFRVAKGGAPGAPPRSTGPDVSRQDHRRRPACRRLRRARRSDGSAGARRARLPGRYAVRQPAAMTAGIWAVKQLSAPLYRHLDRLGTRLAAGLRSAAGDADVPLHVNAVGSVLTPFFSQQPVTGYRAATGADTGAYAAFFHGMLRRGIYPPPSQFEGWFLSAAHTERDIDRTIRAARAALDELAPGRRRSVRS